MPVNYKGDPLALGANSNVATGKVFVFFMGRGSQLFDTPNLLITCIDQRDQRGKF